MSSPYRRFLGVNESADAFALLALTPGQTHPTAIERALENQLARVDRHPDGTGQEARLIKQRLREAARSLHPGRPASGRVISVGGNGTSPPSAIAQPTLAQSLPETPAPAPAVVVPRRPAAKVEVGRVNRLELTVFDRQVLATLVACGGWNAHSRARLVSLAAAQRVSPTGLMKVVRGLSQYAASNSEERIVDVSHITEGASRMQILFPDGGSLAQAAPPQESITSEHVGSGPWATVKLSLLFGAATVLFGVLFIRVLLGPGEPIPEHAGTATDLNEPPALVTQATPPTYNPDRVQVGPVAAYPKAPTFLGETIPDESVAAVDQSPRLADLFDELGRKLTIAQTPSRPFWVSWTDLTRQAGLCWPLLDQSTHVAIRENLMEVVFAGANRPSVTDRLLATLESHADRVNTPVDVWVGCWAVGMLAEIASRSDLPAASRTRATELVKRLTVGDVADGELEPNGAARAWLNLLPLRLLQLTLTDEDSFDKWELWLAAHRRLESGDSFDAAVLVVVEQILVGSIDLGRPGPTVDLLGRMLYELDFQRSALVRDRLVGFFSDSGLDSRDVWVLGSLLAQYDAAPWFGEELVPAMDSTMRERRNTARAVARAWPQLTTAEHSVAVGRGIGVDPELGSRWFMMAEAQIAAARELAGTVRWDETELFERLVMAAWLNEAAAALAGQEVSEARSVLREIEQGWVKINNSGGSPNSRGSLISQGSGATPGSPTGVDGSLTAMFIAARTERDQLDVLRDLRNESGGDLGVLDARTFVRLAYRGTPNSVRAVAREIATELYRHGSNVSVELLDQAADAPKTEGVSDFMSQMTGQILPTIRSAAWPRESRLALIQHALDLRSSDRSQTNRLQRTLGESYSAQHQHLDPKASVFDTGSNPPDALDRLLSLLRSEAEQLMVSNPVPASQVMIERRHATRLSLARGPIEATLARQITVAEYLAYLSVAEQPVLGDDIMTILNDAAELRRTSTHVLEQALQTELAATKVWLLRLVVDDRAARGGGQ